MENIFTICDCLHTRRYAGGLLTVDADVYKKILRNTANSAHCPVFVFARNIKVENLRKSNPYLSVVIGAAIGFLSGLIGIGGGIILSPVLLLLKWTDMKQTAAISALFIFVNSLSGLAGQLTKGNQFQFRYVCLCCCGFLPAEYAAAYFGSLKLRQNILKYLLAISTYCCRV